MKRVPGIARFAERSRPEGEQWLPVTFTPGLQADMLLPDGYYNFSYLGYESAALAWVADNVEPQDVCMDVGGHIGVYAVLMGLLVGPGGRVHSFEPLPDNVEVAWQSVRANGQSEWVSIEQAAVCEVDGEVIELHVAQEANTSEASIHKGGARRLGVPQRQLEVRGVSLDAFVDASGLDRINFIKMDIEGAEESALRGATRILDRFSPSILLEVHGHMGVGALKLLEQMRYEIKMLSGEPVSSETYPDEILHVVARR